MQSIGGGHPSGSSHESATCWTTAYRAFWLKLCIVGGLVAGFLLSSQLWLDTRLYPLTPVWRALRPLRHPWDYCSFALLLVLLLAIGVRQQPVKLTALFVVSAVALTLFDQSRWQPWFFQYLLMISALALSWGAVGDVARQEASLNTCRLIIVSIYFWSGIQKLNPGFIHNVFPWLIAPVIHLLPSTVTPFILRLAIIVPFVELAVGIGLLIPLVRTTAMYGALGMHALLLAALGPFGRSANTVVWSWNMAMAVFVVILFWRADKLAFQNVVWTSRFPFHRVVLALVTVAPLLNLFNLWDNYLSWALYAGNKNEGILYISDAVKQRLPEDIDRYVEEDSKLGTTIDISDWSYGELNVPPYPEVRIYKNVARTICQYSNNPFDVVLVVEGRVTLLDGKKERRYYCNTLGK